MKNTIRCVIACILPCGALDVIRIVHSNGHVEELSGKIRAAEIMKAYPKHVLKKPSYPPDHEGGVAPKIVVVPPDAELQRGKIYFLMPMPSSPQEKKSNNKPKSSSGRRKKRREYSYNGERRDDIVSGVNKSNNPPLCDQYLNEILSEKVSSTRDGRRGRVGVWRPHLESISEMSFEV